MKQSFVLWRAGDNVLCFGTLPVKMENGCHHNDRAHNLIVRTLQRIFNLNQKNNYWEFE